MTTVYNIVAIDIYEHTGQALSARAFSVEAHSVHACVQWMLMHLVHTRIWGACMHLVHTRAFGVHARLVHMHVRCARIRCAHAFGACAHFGARSCLLHASVQ